MKTRTSSTFDGKSAEGLVVGGGGDGGCGRNVSAALMGIFVILLVASVCDMTHSKTNLAMMTVSQQDLKAREEAEDMDDDPCTITWGDIPFPNVPSAASVWSTHLHQIAKSVKGFPLQSGPEWEEWTNALVGALTPQRLQRSRRTVPDSTAVRKVVQILKRRYDYLARRQKHHETNVEEFQTIEAHPLYILVTGGSVTEGLSGDSNPVGLAMNVSSSFSLFDWAWPRRLEQFLNSMLGFHAIVVENEAVGGTTSDTGAEIVQYELYSHRLREAGGPDIVINAYSTNDLVQYYVDDHSRHTTIYQRLESFLEAAKPQSCHEKSPLVIFLDDVVGPLPSVLSELISFNTAMTKLTNSYGLMGISYADAIRDIVHADTKESWFSPPFYDDNGEYAKEIHPGVGGHISISLVVAFNFLSAFLDYCDESRYSENVKTLESSGVLPKSIPKILSPPFMDEVTVMNISDKWHELKEFDTQKCMEPRHPGKKCALTWLAQIRGGRKRKRLFSILKPFIVKSTGWEIVVDPKDKRKVGLEAVGGRDSKLVLEIPVVAKQSVGVIDLLYLKSYGEKWEGSEANLSIMVVRNNSITPRDPLLDTSSSSPPQHAPHIFSLSGFHSSNTSQSFKERTTLQPPASPGDTIQINIVISGGNTFKFTGIFLCRS